MGIQKLETYRRPPVRVFRTEYLPGKGYAVLDPDGGMCGAPMKFRHLADHLRGRLQREADAKSKRGPRACLGCSATFDSEGIHHRLCNGCRRRGDGGSMSIGATSNAKVRRASWA